MDFPVARMVNAMHCPDMQQAEEIKQVLSRQGYSEEQQDTVAAFAHAVKQESEAKIEVANVFGHWSEKVHGKFYHTGKYRIKQPTAEDYLREHKASGLKVGDRVRVLRVPELNEGGWGGPHFLADARTKDVGEIFTIVHDDGGGGFRAANCQWPHFVLEKVEPEYRPWTPEEALGKYVRRKSDGTYHTIVYCNHVGWMRGDRLTPYEVILETCEQLDGSPCGILEEGGAA